MKRWFSMVDVSGNQEIRDLKERIIAIERRLEKIEEKIFKSSNVPEETEKIQTKAPHLSIRLIKKGFHKATYINQDDINDLIEFEFEFENRLKKEIRAFTGIVIFKDLFDRKILEVELTQEGLKAKPRKTFRWKGGIVYNPFLPEHRRLREIPKEDLIVDFNLERVVYTDGTKEFFV